MDAHSQIEKCLWVNGEGIISESNLEEVGVHRDPAEASLIAWCLAFDKYLLATRDYSVLLESC